MFRWISESVLGSVSPGTLTVRFAPRAGTSPRLTTTVQNTIAYYNPSAPLTTLTATFLLANYPESTTIKWFVQPAATSPTVWYGPFPQVVNVHA